MSNQEELRQNFDKLSLPLVFPYQPLPVIQLEFLIHNKLNGFDKLNRESGIRTDGEIENPNIPFSPVCKTSD